MGFWKTLGKIGAFAAPLAAAPFTGGASLALIGAGAGAAGGALSGGGLKGALLGGGLGAIPGLAGLGKGASGVANMGQSAVNGVEDSILGGGGPSGIMGFLGKLKGAGIDPTTLGLGALSALGDNGGPQKVNSFKGTDADPVKTMTSYLDQLHQQNAAPPPSSARMRMPSINPVTLPGIPFQIGGGLGTDPSQVPVDPSSTTKRRTV